MFVFLPLMKVFSGEGGLLLMLFRNCISSLRLLSRGVALSRSSFEVTCKGLSAKNLNYYLKNLVFVLTVHILFSCRQFYMLFDSHFLLSILNSWSDSWYNEEKTKRVECKFSTVVEIKESNYLRISYVSILIIFKFHI